MKIEDVSESEIIAGAREMQTFIDAKIASGEKSLALRSLNLHLKRGLIAVGNANSEHRPESGKRNWVKSSAKKVVEEQPVVKTEKVADDDSKFIEELKTKSVEQLTKMSKTALAAIIATINNAPGLEEDAPARITFEEDATKAILAQLIFDYLNAEEEEEEEEEEGADPQN